VELRVAPPGERGERIAVRTREVLVSASVDVDASIEATASGLADSAVTDGALARVVIDASDDARITVRVQPATGPSLSREIALTDGRFDEAACEEIAAVVASSVEALREAEPLTPRAAAPVAAVAPIAAAPFVAAPQPTSASPPPAPIARSPAPIAQPEPTAQPARTAGASARSDRGPRAELQLRAGYEAAIWGEGRVLHGPRLALSYGWPFAFGRLGAGVEGFVGWPMRLESAQLDADVSAQAVRVLATYDSSLAPGFAFDAAAGVSLQFSRLVGRPAIAATVARAAQTRIDGAARVYGGARFRSGRWLLALGMALEIDPQQVEYGVQHPDGFVVTQAPWRVRPSLLINAGVAF
jgi:hypothetical protein